MHAYQATATATATIYLASYKGTRPGFKGVHNRLIRWATKSAYSHTEICIGDPFVGPVYCLSSVGREGGVRIKRMQLSPAKWDVIELPSVKQESVWAFLFEHDKADYDHIGTVRSLLPFVGREHPHKWFCSEVAAAVIGIKEPWRMHPGVLHRVMEPR